MRGGLASGAAVARIVRRRLRSVPDPSPASPRLIAGLSNSANAGPIGCTSGRDALEFGAAFGALALGDLPDFSEDAGFFAMLRIWGESASQ